jgi:hypothetical protein
MSEPKFVAVPNPRPAREPEAAPAAACHATSGGIIQCLHMLAEEAGSLGLGCTVRALWVAITVCEHEAAPSTLFTPGAPMATSVN